jgi:hypothetical protein
VIRVEVLPPYPWPASKTVTCTPRSASARAAVDPAMPLPRTATRREFVVCTSMVRIVKVAVKCKDIMDMDWLLVCFTMIDDLDCSL